LFGLYVRSRRQVVVCSSDNQTQTLLHESWHIVQSQYLKGSPYVDEVLLRVELPALSDENWCSFWAHQFECG
jgi:hypothetical protein